MSQSDPTSAAEPDHDPASWLRRFVDLLLNCPTMQTPSGRRGVLTMLPGDLPHSIGDQNETNNRLAVTALARGCASTEGGIAALLERLTFFDGGTTSFKEVTDFLAANPTPPPTAFPQDKASQKAAIRTISMEASTYNEGNQIKVENSGGTSVTGSTIHGNVTTNTTNEYHFHHEGQSIPRSPLAPPPAPTHFAGRENDLKELEKALSQNPGGKIALTALRGQPGIGKTTLARQLAYDVYTNKLFEAVLWVEVNLKPDPWSVLRRWATYCGITIDEAHPDWDTTAGQVKTIFGEMIKGRVLVVFDDVWVVGVTMVRDLLKALPNGATALVTSRDMRVATALAARTVEVKTLPTEEAVAFLRQYLSDKELPQAELEALAEALKGHALALTLAAKRLNGETHPAAALTRHIREYHRGLPTGSAVAKLELGEEFTGKEDSLRVALAYSYDTLTPQQQARFRALGVLAYDQPFDIELLLLGLWDLEPDSEDDEAWGEARDTARHWVEELYKFSLIEPALETELGEGWYRQHPILHSYALALLKTSLEEETAARDRYYDWATRIAEQFLKLQHKPEEWGFLTPYLPHIHEAGDALYARYQANSNDEAIFRCVLAFARHIYIYLYYRQEVHKREWLEMGLIAAQVLCKRSDEGGFLNGLASYYDNRGYKTEALKYYEEALAIYRELNDQQNLASSLNNIGIVYQSLSQMEKALEFFELALPISHQTGNRNLEATTLNNIGLVYQSLGQMEKALEFFELALSISRQIHYRNSEAVFLNNIGLVYHSLSQMEKALEFFELSLPILRQAGNRNSEAKTLNNIGLVYQSLGQMKKALEFFELALSISRQTGNRNLEANTLNNIGLVYQALSEREKALEFFELALPVLRQTGDRNSEATALNNVGMVYQTLGQLEKALEFFELALPILRQTGDRNNEAIALNNVGMVYQSLDQREKALEFFELVLPISRQTGNRNLEANTLNNIGTVYQSLGQMKKALEFFELTIPILRQTGNLSIEASTLNNIGGVYVGLGNQQEALNYYQQALRLMKAVGNRTGEAATLNNIGIVYAGLDNQQEALNYYQQALLLSRTLGDRAGEAITCYSIGIVYYKTGRLQEALEYLTRCVELEELIQHPDLASDRADLERLKAELSDQEVRHKETDQE